MRLNGGVVWGEHTAVLQGGLAGLQYVWWSLFREWEILLKLYNLIADFDNNQTVCRKR